MPTSHLLPRTASILLIVIVAGGLAAYWVDSSYYAPHSTSSQSGVQIVGSSWTERWLNNTTSAPVKYAALSGTCLNGVAGSYAVSANFSCYFINPNVTRVNALNGSDVKVEITSVDVNPPFKVIGPAVFYVGVPSNWQVFGVEFQAPPSAGSYPFSGAVNFVWYS